MSEEDLVARAKNGDREAWGEIYQAYVDRIYRYIASKIGRGMEAEDLSGQVFLKAFQSLSGYKWQGKAFSSWLFSIAHNLIVDRFRKEDVQRRFLAQQDPTPPQDDDPQGLAERAFQMEQVVHRLGRLTPAQQEVISLRFAAELSLEETAQAMKRSAGAVKALQHSALAALRKALKEDGIL